MLGSSAVCYCLCWSFCSWRVHVATLESAGGGQVSLNVSCAGKFVRYFLSINFNWIAEI